MPNEYGWPRKYWREGRSQSSFPSNFSQTFCVLVQWNIKKNKKVKKEQNLSVNQIMLPLRKTYDKVIGEGEKKLERVKTEF